FLNTLKERHDFIYEINITLADGTCLEPLTNADLTSDGCTYYEGCGSSSFPLGACISKYIEINLANLDGRWQEYDFYRAEVEVHIALEVDGEEEGFYLGTFTVTEPEDYGTTVTIIAYDHMYQADKNFDFSQIPPSSTTGIWVLFDEICRQIGLTPHEEQPYSIYYDCKTPSEDVTCRQLLSEIAMLCHGVCKCDEYNRVKIISYLSGYNAVSDVDGGDYEHYNQPYDVQGMDFEHYSDENILSGGEFGSHNYHTFNMPFTLNTSTDDVVITGLKSTVDNVEYSYGTDGYTFDLKNSLFYDVNKALTLIGEAVVTDRSKQRQGLVFRPFEMTMYAYPCCEIGDYCRIEGRRENYVSFITDIEFKFRGASTFKCSANDPIRNSSKHYSVSDTIVGIRDNLNQEIGERKSAIESMEQQIKEAGGFYITPNNPTEQAEVYYMHNKKILDESNIVWKITSSTISVSTDYNLGEELRHWNASLNAEGTAILKRIFATGLILGGSDEKGAGYDGYLKCLDRNDNTVVTLDVNGLTTNSAHITGGIIEIDSSSETQDYIRLSYNNEVINLSPSRMYFGIKGTSAETDRIGTTITKYSILSRRNVDSNYGYTLIEGDEINVRTRHSGYLTVNQKSSLGTILEVRYGGIKVENSYPSDYIALDISGISNFKGDVSVTKDVVLNSTVTNTTTIKGSLSANSDVTLNNSIADTTKINGK
ncbi:MAG: hypothetical protein HUJ56_00945, partial [Erysipelotrichaceae bacterium]|nr:hypothetical protein [Erysipelotrichaceae bacterium]